MGTGVGLHLAFKVMSSSSFESEADIAVAPSGPMPPPLQPKRAAERADRVAQLAATWIKPHGPGRRPSAICTICNMKHPT